MLSVNAAKKMILESQPAGEPEETSLADAYGLILAEDVFSPIDLPVFDSSAMDGYALRAEETSLASAASPVFLRETEDIWAGKTSERAVAANCCARIMTGAKMPEGANAVVMREKVLLREGGIALDQPVPFGDNVRKKGEEIRRGDKILNAGITLTAPAIAVLAGSGIPGVKTCPRPRVTIIPTGSELKSPGEVLSGAQIYESNSFALAAALAELGIKAAVHAVVPDDKKALHTAVEEALDGSTHVLMIGGVSVGDYDHNKAVLADCRVTEVLWKVAQKPGKPLFVGKRKETMVFGLPGNPASSLTCFYEYVRPALLKFMGGEAPFGLFSAQARLAGAFTKKTGLTHFIRGHAAMTDGRLAVVPLDRQQSHMMSSFAEANCLLVIPEESGTMPAGAIVEIHWLPGKGVLCA